MKAGRRQAGFTLINLVKGGVVPVVGIATSMILFRKFTSLPSWACAVLSIPAFLIFFLGSLYLLTRLTKK